MLFSCTWNEKRKKAMAERKRACGRRMIVGAGPAVLLAEGVRLRPSEKLTPSTATMLGRTAVTVAANASLASVDTGASSRSLTTTLSAHQTLATLSSNSPRAKGKMRWIAWRKVEIEVRKGAKSTTKVKDTASARLMKSERLLQKV